MRVLGFVLALLVWMLAATVALAEEGRWQKLENNPACVVWNDNPQEQETVTWSGACANGKAHGRGTEVWRHVEDGEWQEARYEGGMKDGKRDGRGKSTSENGVYEGDWKDSKANGRGIWVEANGDRYEGEFKDDKFHGPGKFTNEDGVYEGDWKDGLEHGHGLFVGANGDRYEGDFKDGKKHGRGIYVWGPNSEPAGDRYEGFALNRSRPIRRMPQLTSSCFCAQSVSN